MSHSAHAGASAFALAASQSFTPMGFYSGTPWSCHWQDARLREVSPSTVSAADPVANAGGR